MSPLNIAIVGAGIGGPAAAIGLARNGHQVTIYERSKAGTEVGYAFRVTENSDRCLKHLGIDTVAGGAAICMETSENTDPSQIAQSTSVFAYHPQLVKQLMDTALANGVSIRTGVKVTSVDVPTTTLTLSTNETIHADLILAADGVHSIIRSQIVDAHLHHPIPSSNQNAFRFILPTTLVRADPLASSILTPDSHMFSWTSGDRRIIVYAVDHGNLLNVTLSHPARMSDRETDKDEAAATSYNEKADFETVRDVHAGWDPRAIRLLELADPDGFRIWKLMDMDEIPRCSLNHTALLGDACHPVLPSGFSGASMAIEDAVTLAEFLGSDVRMEEVPALLELYEEVRKPRVARVREEARKRAKGDGEKAEMQAYRRFLAEHDAVGWARERLVDFKQGKEGRRGGNVEVDSV